MGQLDWVWTFFQQAFVTTSPGPGSPLMTERHSLSPPGAHELVGEENKTSQNCEALRHQTEAGTMAPLEAHVLAIVNSAAMSIEVHVSFWILAFSGHMPSRGMAGSYGRFIPSILRNLQSIFHNSFANLHSNKQSRRVLFVDVFLMAIPTRVKWYFIVVLICISLIKSDVEHFSCVYSLSIFRSIYNFSFKKIINGTAG